MSDLDPASVVDATPDGANDEEDLAEAYEALAEDRRHQEMERTDLNAARSSELRSDEEAALVADDAPDPDGLTADDSALPPVAEVDDIQTGVPPLPADQALAESPVAEPDARVASRAPEEDRAASFLRFPVALVSRSGGHGPPPRGAA